MRELLKFEARKILMRQVNQIAMLLGLLLIIVCNVMFISGRNLYIDDENQLKGLNAVEYQENTENLLTAELEEDFLTSFLSEYQRKIKADNVEYDWKLIAPASNLYSLLAEHYTEWNGEWDWETLHEIPVKERLNFYDRRLEKIENLLNAEYSFGNYSDIEKAYWIQKAEAVKTPFLWGSKETWNYIWNSIGILFYLVFVISICIAPVFAGEYQNKTDALILSAKNGRNKIMYAKILASFFITFFYILFCGCIGIGINVLMLGTKGWQLPIQLWNTIIPYNWTVLEACLVNLIVIFLSSFLMVAISLLLSTVSKNPMIVLAVDALLFFGTVFLPSAKGNILWNRILILLPIHTVNFKGVLKTYMDYPFGNHIIPYVGMIFIVYILLTLICLWFTGKSYHKYQVSGR